MTPGTHPELMDRSSSLPDTCNEASASRPKRRKVAVACDECRVRKVRCDGVQPVCGPCAKRDHGVQCVYTGEPEKRRATQNYITVLEDRIRHLESPRNHAGNASTPYSFRQSSRANNTEFRDDKRPSQQYPSNGDGVNAMMGAIERELPTQDFFGSSSAASFMRQIKIAVDDRVSSPHHKTSDSAHGMRSSPNMLDGTKEMFGVTPNYVLPPRKTADSLMGVYWCLVFPLYPFVDSMQIKAEYARIWTAEKPQSDENMLMCMLNVIFALACQLADFIQPEDRGASADAFFSRAKDLLQFNLWNTGSSDLIQCLLLMAQYLQSTDSAHQCWIVTGLAIRNAQSLGLHLPQAIMRLASFQEQQLARNIWHGCVLMDRVIAMTFGRPTMISKAACGPVPLPAIVDEEYLSGPGAVSQPANRPSMMDFYAKSLELYEILQDILISLYKPSPERSPPDVHGFHFDSEGSDGERTIFDLDRSLTRWSRSLPAHLRGQTESEVYLRQSVVLRARFLHVRILLFRPSLSKYCTARDTTTPDPLVALEGLLPQRVALQCSIICVKVAQEVIELVYCNIPTGSSDFLPAWWYNILYVYTAATVLIAGHLRPTVLAEVTLVEINHSWNRALEILRNYQSYSRSARRCVAALEILYARVVSESASTQRDFANNQPVGASANVPNEFSWGEEVNALFEGFDMADLQDMSWLNSVPRDW